MRKIHSLYIHYPYCKHLCHYCDFYKHLYNSDSEQDFARYLDRSLKINRDFLGEEGFEIGNLNTLYIGGGTPSLMGQHLIPHVEKIKKYYDVAFNDDYEFTIEVDPGAYESTESLKKVVDYGVNRVSIGIQSLDPVVHKYLDRSHQLDEVYKLIESIAKLDVNYSVDFIIGVIGKEYHQRDIEKELEEILKFDPNHISLYILSVNKSYKYYNLLPSEDDVADEYQRVHEYLTDNEFTHYEVSNYAKADFESKHNWNYWQQGSYACLGPSATGLLVGSNSGCRYRWKPSGDIDLERLSKEQLRLEKLYTQARTKKGIEKSLISDHALLDSDYFIDTGERFVVPYKYWSTLDTIITKLL